MKIARRILPMVALLMLSLVSPLVLAQQADDPPPGEYRIVDGKVDQGTYTGWRLFHSSCHSCHGVDALGTDLAPSLVDKIKALTPRTFTIKVLTSYRLFARAGQSRTEQYAELRDAQLEEILRRKRSERSAIVMPAWKKNKTVEPHVLDLYAYLTARAEGQLGVGEPSVMK